MNKHLLIGSRALNYWFPQHKIKPETDWDVITYDTNIQGIERHDPDFLYNKEFEMFSNDTERVLYRGYWLEVVRPMGLAIIKRSHLWRNLSFDKHITMYHKYLSGSIPSYGSEAFNLLKERTELTMKAFPQKHPKLNVTVEEFFDDYVTKKYNHDYLHELVAHDGIPMYRKLQQDETKAWCNKDMWYNLTLQEKINCVSEEAYVIGLERFVIPNDWNFPYRVAYHKALNKICTTLCSGWFRDFAIDNYPAIYDNFNSSKFEEVKHILNTKG